MTARRPGGATAIDPGRRPEDDDPGSEPPVILPTTSRPWARLDAERASQVAFWLAVPVVVIALAYVNRHQWFRADEYQFIVDRRRTIGDAPLDTLMRPHNEHWQAVPMLLYLGVFRVFRMSSYLPFLGVLWALHIGVVLSLRAVLDRAGYDRVLVNGVSILALFLWSGMENLAWAFQYGFVGATGLGLAALVLSDRDGRLAGGDIAAVALLAVGLTFGGPALAMVLVVVVSALLRRRWRRALVFAAVPGTVFALWYLVWGRGGQRVVPTPQAMPSYIWRGLTATVDAVSQLTTAGAALIVAAGLAMVWRSRHGRLSPLVVSCSVGAVAFFFVGGLARAQFGPDQAASPRYLYIAGMLLLPALAGLLDELLRYGARAGRVAIVVLLSWALLGNVAAGLGVAQTGQKGANDLRWLLAGLTNLPSFAELRGETRVDGANPELDVAAVREIISENRATLPGPDAAGLVQAANQAEWSVSNGPPGDPRLTSAAGVNGTVVERDGGCLRLSAEGPAVTMMLESDARSTVTFDDDVPGGAVHMIDGLGHGSTARDVVPIGEALGLLVDHPDFTMVVRLPVSSARVCGVHLAEDD